MAIAHVLINCSPGSGDSIINELKNFDGVRNAYQVMGAFDIVVKLESPNLQEIRDNIMHDIKKIRNIISMVTLMNVD